MKGPFRDNCLKYYYLLLAVLKAGWVVCIRRALVLGLVLIAGAAIEHASSPRGAHVVVVCHDQVRRQVSQGFRCRGS